MFLLYIDANSVTNSTKGSKATDPSSTEAVCGPAMQFTMKDLYAIEQIQSEPNLFRLIVG